MKKTKVKEARCIDTNIILGIGGTIAHKYKKNHKDLDKFVFDQLSHQLCISNYNL